MVKKNRTKAKLKAGGRAYGISVSPGEVSFVDLAGALGFDYVMIDWEHYLFDAGEIDLLIRAAQSHGMTPLVRMELNTEHIAHVLNAGAQGILIARVNGPDQVRILLDAAKFHPEGRRTIFFNGRATNYRQDLAGMSDQAFSLELNEEILIGCIIEEISGAEHLADILAFPEIDMIHLGPADLAHSMGWPEQRVVEAVSDRIVGAALDAGKALSTTWGVRAGASEDAELSHAFSRGYRMFAVSPRSYFKAGGAQFLRHAEALGRQTVS